MLRLSRFHGAQKMRGWQWMQIWGMTRRDNGSHLIGSRFVLQVSPRYVQTLDCSTYSYEVSCSDVFSCEGDAPRIYFGTAMRMQASMDSWCCDAEMLCAMLMNLSCLDSCAGHKLHAMCAVLQPGRTVCGYKEIDHQTLFQVS